MWHREEHGRRTSSCANLLRPLPTINTTCVIEPAGEDVVITVPTNPEVLIPFVNPVVGSWIVPIAGVYCHLYFDVKSISIDLIHPISTREIVSSLAFNSRTVKTSANQTDAPGMQPTVLKLFDLVRKGCKRALGA